VFDNEEALQQYSKVMVSITLILHLFCVAPMFLLAICNRHTVNVLMTTTLMLMMITSMQRHCNKKLSTSL